MSEVDRTLLGLLVSLGSLYEEGEEAPYSLTQITKRAQKLGITLRISTGLLRRAVRKSYINTSKDEEGQLRVYPTSIGINLPSDLLDPSEISVDRPPKRPFKDILVRPGSPHQALLEAIESTGMHRYTWGGVQPRHMEEILVSGLVRKSGRRYSLTNRGTEVLESIKVGETEIIPVKEFDPKWKDHYEKHSYGWPTG